MKKTLFNDGFEFKMYPFSEDLLDIRVGLDSKDYQPVSIPHDATIHDAHNFYSDYVIWYKKKIGIIPSPQESVYLYFEGVYMVASIYINDVYIGQNVNGYTSFFFDISEYITSPEDELLVSIDYRCPNSRWYAGPGINRNVWLYQGSKNHFEPDSLYVCPTRIQKDNWDLYIAATPTQSFSEIEFICEELNIHTRLSTTETTLNISCPKLWDISSPYLYTLTANLLVDGTVVDSTETRFGFRDVVFTTDRGMFLNDRHIKLNGVCLHSDSGCLGTAFFEDAARRQLQLMKDMGANAIRLTHNVQAPGFLDLCDEMGFLVLNEAFDCWKREKTPYDYARFFEQWSKKDIRSWVCRDRNHPCVFMWSAGNEIYDTHAGPEGKETLEYIVCEIRKHDYKNHAYITLCSNYMAWENTINAVESIKIAGYNYGEFLYEDHRREHPDWIIFGSETASCVQSRGIYHFPLSQSLLVDDDEHCSSLGNCCTSWGATNLDFCLSTERDTPFSLGQFYWSGTDYLGEPTPYHTKSSYFGMADTAGFPKDAYYINQAEWISVQDMPMIHILPYWDFNEGQLIDVRVCSNAPEVELFFNEVSMGRFPIDHAHGTSFYADYRIAYHPGILKAVGYDVDGNIIVQTTEQSFGDTSYLKLSESSFDVDADDTHLHFIEIEAMDENGNPVRNASDRVNITINGPAKLIGIDNGNNTDYESFKGTSMRMFGGKLLAVVQPDKEAGHIDVIASVDAERAYVRKLEIQSSQRGKITPANPVIDVNIKVYPQTASYKSIEYQITNDNSVQIPNAVVETVSEDFLHAKIRVLADCDFRIRALCHEYDGRVTYISQLEYSAEGFGSLHINPYTFVCASLFSDAIGELGNGNERGIATSRTESNYILYKDVDFGPVGSNTITLPIFELDNTPFTFTFWKGMPHAEGSYVIGSGTYDKKSIWSVYQEDTYVLNETLKGLCDFGIETNCHKCHIKGFIFTEFNKAYELNKAIDSVEIYGDDYTTTDTLVEKIGNNVSMVFKNMDFGENGASKITIHGKTPLDQNTIHIRFSNSEVEKRQIVEFIHSDEITDQTFELSPICGKGDITFLFLPGCNFDFESFKFEP